MRWDTLGVRRDTPGVRRDTPGVTGGSDGEGVTGVARESRRRAMTAGGLPKTLLS